MNVGIIGAGGIGQAFAKHVAQAGYEVLLSNSRGPESLADAVEQLGGNTKAVTQAEAAQADIVFVAIPWDKLSGALASLPSMAGRIVIDATNPILPGFKTAELHGKFSSQLVAEQLPGAKVVKAFNTLFTAILGSDPNEAGGHRVIFYSGDDADAKATVAELITKIGFAGVDLGTLADGSKLQSFPGGTVTGLNLIKLG
jgi:predicted dinucleotide-binding enzyme